MLRKDFEKKVKQKLKEKKFVTERDDLVDGFIDDHFAYIQKIEKGERNQKPEQVINLCVAAITTWC